MKKADLHSRLSYALALVRGRSGVRPRAGVVLGSGLATFADRLLEPTVIPYQDIPEFPVSRVPGHPGRLILGNLPTESGTIPIAALQGRAHAYEGWGADDVAFGARVLCGLGVKTLVVTNAAGGVNPAFEPGALVRITDHINLSGANPLTGENDDRVGPRFVDLTHAYDVALGAQLEACAGWLGIPLHSGVYACMPGPSYETPAEIRMLRTLGADLVGMSTVPEVIAARHMGVRVAGISLVTNRAAGLHGAPLSHAEVQTIAAREGERLAALLTAFLPFAAG
ncbi:MAG TPA: purine-nucleoside phosphorylase [Anaeromyxobacteraceae bacterium]|nr:purine-nucleoside phosphorylase [Anaeromyxobacteraceae bacterium]